MQTFDSKYNQLVEALRGQLVQGVYRPGDRLPNRSEIGKTFGVGMATVQKALDYLIEDGFVHARAGMGTFVAENPPHLTSYALAFPSTASWSRFYAAVRQGVRQIERERNLRFREYLTSRDVDARGEVAQLCRAVASQRLAGVIISGAPEDLKDTPILTQSSLPKVVFSDWPGVDFPTVLLDVAGFVRRAVEYLHARGRRRIAHLSLDFPALELEKFVKAIRDAGAEVRPYWIQSVPMQSLFRAAANITHLLMELDGDKRPDALIIHDDNLVDHAVAGLIAAGVRAPADIEVVTLCNYPLPVPSALPVKQLGMDCRMLIQTCLDILDMQRRGEKPPAVTMLQPLFEEELETATGAARFTTRD